MSHLPAVGTAHASPRPIRQPSRADLRSLRAAVAGNILEWFDWTLYAVFSTYLAAHFFDRSDPASALLATLAVFAVGFVARPFGGLIFGAIADRYGRRAVLISTISTMAVTSLVIALLPGYEQIGVWSSAALLATRLVQGLAHGGESGVSYTYVAEIAPAERRGLWSSSVFFAVTLGVMAATSLGAVLTLVLGQEETASYGWRLAFVAGALLGLFVLVLRRSAAETETFSDQNPQAEAATAPIGRANSLKIGGLVILLAAGHNCAYYIWATFAPSFAISAKGMDPSGAFLASLAAQALALGLIVFWGAMSDRIGRRKQIIAMGVVAILTYFPLSLLISGEPWTLFIAQTVGMGVWAMGASMYPAMVSELFPTRIRAAGVGFATSVSVAAFGGTAPLLLTWSNQSGNGWIFWLWIGVLSLLAVIGGLLVRESKGSDLRSVPSPFRRSR
ncbi:MFS transporter [Spongiactinospora rosea]|uniref:MFS transporter n=1 Tax=Spongiactinospora rosea TaxID=2248750 RepID=A0A366LVN3_9ACTN|nr:MFS transporter [Spongiactinospora rosea]RBQ18006.1 MFS transporter [Spongiactinospora rosea]